MGEEDPQEARRDELLHQVCDKGVYEAISRLDLVNKGRCRAVKERVLQYFNEHRCMISGEIYRRLVGDIGEGADVVVRRRANLYDLEDLESIDDL